jgi:MinD superfamily P-loop ATPase
VLEKMNIPRGVLVNKSGIGDQKVYEYLEKKNIPLLMEIPQDRKIAELYSHGEIFAEKMPEWKTECNYSASQSKFHFSAQIS